MRKGGGGGEEVQHKRNGNGAYVQSVDVIELLCDVLSKRIARAPGVVMFYVR